MKNNEFTEKEIKIFTFFHQNQGKDFEMDFLVKELKASEILINECLFCWQKMVETKNMKFKKNEKQVCEQINLMNMNNPETLKLFS